MLAREIKNMADNDLIRDAISSIWVIAEDVRTPTLRGFWVILRFCELFSGAEMA
jgi:hypothetical protein